MTLLIAFALAAAAPRGAVLVASGAWTAIDRGQVCEALSQSPRAVPKGQPKPVAGFAFSPDRRRWGEFHARLSRASRPGSSILLTVAGQPFLLVSRGNSAWSRGPSQEQAIIAALRTAGSMRIEGRDGSGRRISDPYVLEGAPTAIDAAAARCALRGAGKIP
ncbi:MAG: hypothetical protein V4513_05255 [Pseudomonadota bacterium]